MLTNPYPDLTVGAGDRLQDEQGGRAMMRLEKGARTGDDVLRRRQGVAVYVVGALLLTFILIAAAGVFCPIHGEASFRELLIRDCLIEQPACSFSCHGTHPVQKSL
jgi:hypothetical protein